MNITNEIRNTLSSIDLCNKPNLFIGFFLIVNDIKVY